MKTIAFELDNLLNGYLEQLSTWSDETTSTLPAPGKWSKKELLGHLIDSAQNNIRRFIVTQYEETPRIVYNQDKWVEAQHYSQYSWNDLVQLWYLQNRQLVTVLRYLPADAVSRQCQTEGLHTLEWLAADYFRHLQHHLHQILELEPVAYP